VTPQDERGPGVPESGAPNAAAPKGAVPAQSPDPLPIRKIDYLGPMAAAGGWRPETTLPEVAFSGRSNVGKSSLINALVRRKALARVSKTPGRTREIHFFGINDAFTLVDLPGYGYAKISKDRQAEWRPLIEGYLRHAPSLRGIVQLLDVRRDPTDDDLAMFDLLSEIGLPTLVCVTKTDKLSKGAIGKQVQSLARRLALDPEQVIAFSSITGEGRQELAEAVMSLVSSPVVAESD
jgi:GTP-binding protein